MFFMLVLLRKTSFLTTFFGLCFNQQGTYYRLQFLLGLKTPYLTEIWTHHSRAYFQLELGSRHSTTKPPGLDQRTIVSSIIFECNRLVGGAGSCGRIFCYPFGCISFRLHLSYIYLPSFTSPAGLSPESRYLVP